MIFDIVCRNITYIQAEKMEDVEQFTTVTLTQEELEMLVQARAVKMIEQQQQQVFRYFRAAFLQQFASSRCYQKTSVNLFSMKQRSKETLRAYIQHFNKVVMDIPLVSSKTMMNVFTQGLVEGEFFRSVIRKPLKDFDHLLRKANERVHKCGRRPSDKEEGSAGRAYTGTRAASDKKAPTTQGAKSGGSTSTPGGLDACCATCVRRLAEGVERQEDIAATPHLLIGEIDIDPSGGERTKEGRRSSTVNNSEGITLIPPESQPSETGLPLGRKKIEAIKERVEGLEISFSPRDLEGVEIQDDDALIIRAVIANSPFTGLSSTREIRFKRNEVLPISQARLIISLGEESLRRIRTTNFIVVDALLAYNVILGRPALNEFRVVVSTYYQKIKFLVDDQVGEVKVDQLASRCCYVEMVKIEVKVA
ncbi:uncharacterized protein LOC121995327 [Zingiber officinale]|uniref:uncharacterized protein LOC121995327 n=1 Tax=Zingiber officinale TaxID=94328 RepID=UPI001C4DC50C|nr:uncharacterized protein LOC121995327 [Zingiber officinale]